MSDREIGLYRDGCISLSRCSVFSHVFSWFRQLHAFHTSPVGQLRVEHAVGDVHLAERDPVGELADTHLGDELLAAFS